MANLLCDKLAASQRKVLNDHATILIRNVLQSNDV